VGGNRRKPKSPCGVSVVSYVGNAAIVPKCFLNRIRQQFLVERLPELLAHAAATCANTVTPNCLRLVFTARIGIQLVPPTAVTSGDDAGKITVGNG
jgi:hypothetical protein